MLLRAIIKKALFPYVDMKAQHIQAPLSKQRKISKMGQGKREQRKISYLTILRQSLPLDLSYLSLMMPLKKGMVIGSMIFTGLDCFCSKHMARQNMLT